MGNVLFQTHDNREHLRMMEKIIGPFSREIIVKLIMILTAVIIIVYKALSYFSELESRKYFRNNHVDYPTISTENSSIEFVSKLKSIKQIIKPQSQTSHEFLDLIQKLLNFNPQRRYTATEALSHPFLK